MSQAAVRSTCRTTTTTPQWMSTRSPYWQVHHSTVYRHSSLCESPHEIQHASYRGQVLIACVISGRSFLCTPPCASIVQGGAVPSTLYIQRFIVRSHAAVTWYASQEGACRAPGDNLSFPKRGACNETQQLGDQGCKMTCRPPLFCICFVYVLYMFCIGFV